MSKLKMVEWDVANHMNRKPMTSIPSEEVAVIISDKERFVITIDQVEKAVIVKKVSSGSLDTIVIKPVSSNKIYIK